MNKQFSINDFTSNPVSPSYSHPWKMNTQSVEANASGSDDSDIEVIACCRQIPVQPQTSIAGRQLTTDLSGCANSEFPDIPWDDFNSIFQMAEDQADPLNRGDRPEWSPKDRQSANWTLRGITTAS